MWGTDSTATWTAKAGQINVFAAVDNFTGECLGIHPRHKIWARHEALETIRQAVKPVYGKYDAEVAADLCLQHNHGSQYGCHHFQTESTFLRI